MEYLKKEEAYKIFQQIKREVKFQYDTNKYGLDEFPATGNSKGNKLGKQVKVPLSTHSMGKQSFLFKSEYCEKKYDKEF